MGRVLVGVVLLAASVSAGAQEDSAKVNAAIKRETSSSLECPSVSRVDKVNTLSFGLNFMTHGEIVRGGLPLDGDDEVEDRSNFLLGRTRIIVDYSRPYLQAHMVIQNKAVWGSSGNQTLNLYEGWVKMTANNGLFAQVGRIAPVSRTTCCEWATKVTAIRRMPFLPTTRMPRTCIRAPIIQAGRNLTRRC